MRCGHMWVLIPRSLLFCLFQSLKFVKLDYLDFPGGRLNDIREYFRRVGYALIAPSYTVLCLLENSPTCL